VAAKDAILHGKDGALFEARWQRAPQSVSNKSRGNKLMGDWLIVADQVGKGGIGGGLAKKLSQAGARCTIWNPDGEGDSVMQARRWNGVAYLRALDSPTSDELKSEMLPSCLSPSCKGLLDLVQHLAANQGDYPPQLLLVTRGAAFVFPEQRSISILQAPLLGMSQAIREEHPEWHCKCVDLDPGNSVRAVDFLSDEIQAGGAEDQIAFRGEERFVSRLELRTDRRSSNGTHQKSLPTDGAAAVEMRATKISAFGTYLIAGGLGALGLQVACWLVVRGARDVVLVGRSDPSAHAQKLITWAEANGARVHVLRADISRMDDVKRVLCEISQTMPPLRGIVHTAAVLDDGVLTQQTWERFERVLAPKVSGAWTLHELTEDLPLDFFVLFSSVASLLGAPGQANYAAANAFEDALAHHRRLLGKPAVSINWGAWSEGLAVREGLETRQSELGLIAMSPEKGLALLDSILVENPTQIGAGFFDWNKFLRRYPKNSVPRRFANLGQSEGEQDVAKSGEPELLVRLNAAPESDRMTVLREFIQELAVRILGFNPGRRMNVEQPLNELGLDSLMAVEFRNALAAAVGHSLPATLLFSYPAIQDLTIFAASLLLNERKPESGTQATSGSSDVLGNIEDLSDEEVERMLATGRKDTL
jgi:NADP-dependent 3-hydroxy acid dehydrogenase YdfG/acyl carrier protein